MYLNIIFYETKIDILGMRKFSRLEVGEHNSNNSAWMVIGNKVYDVTKFLDEVLIWFLSLKNLFNYKKNLLML